MSSIPHIATMGNIGKLWGWWGWGIVPMWPYVLQIGNGGNLSPADATTYYFGNGLQASTIDSTDVRLYVPQKGILKKCYIEIRNGWTAWTTETSTMYILVTTPAWATTEYAMSPSITTNNANNSFSDTALAIPLNEWDYIGVKWVAPTWVTNPTALSFWFVFAVEPAPCVLSGSKYVIQWGSTWLSPASDVPLYIGDWPWVTAETVRIRVPYAWVVTSAIVNIRNSTTWTPTAWTAWFNVRLNATTSESIGTSALWSTNVDLLNTSLTTVVAAWDFLSLQFTNPTWTTAPTAVVVTFTFVITVT